MEEPSEEEYWSDYYEDYSKFYEGEGKLKWIWKKGVCLGKKMVVTGVVISSAPFVLPPIVALSAIGVAFWVPAGFALATYACTDKIMNTLLPMPSPPASKDFGMMSSDDEEYDVDEDGLEEGYEEVDDIEADEKEFEEDTRKEIEMRIGLVNEGPRDVGSELDQLPIREDEPDARVQEAEIAEEGGYEEDIGDYMGTEEQLLESSAIPSIVDGIQEAEDEISLLEREGIEAPRDSLRALVVEAEVGGDNESNVEQVSEGVAFLPPSDVKEMNVQEGAHHDDIRKSENQISFTERGGVEMPREALCTIAVEALVGEEEDTSVEQAAEDMAFSPPSETKEKNVKNGTHGDIRGADQISEREELEMPRDALCTIAIEAVVGEEEDRSVEQAAEDMAFILPGGMEENLRKGPHDDIREAQNQTSFIGREGFEMPRDALCTVAVEAVVGEVEDSGVEQASEDMPLVPPSDIKETNVEKGGSAGIKKERRRRGAGRSEGVEKPRDSLLALFMGKGKAKASGINEKNIDQGTENLTFIPPRELKEGNEQRQDLAEIDEGELRRETTGLLGQIRDEGREEYRQHDTRGKEKSERSEQNEGIAVNDMSLERRDKNLFVIPEEVKPSGTAGVKEESKAAHVRSEKENSSGSVYQQKPVIEKKLVVNVRPSGDHTATHVRQENDSDEKLGTLIFAGTDADEMAGGLPDESEALRQDVGTFDNKREGEDNAVAVNIEYHEVLVESVAVFKPAETLQNREIFAGSDKALVDEKKIWDQIRALRTIIGYKDAPHASCVEELEALYVFTGVEPPASFKDTTDLVDVNEKLHFLMSIVGVK